MTEISLLHYFMAHAPEEPQNWFEPEMPSLRPQKDHFASSDGFRHYKNEDDAIRECKSEYMCVTKDGQSWGHAVTLWDIEYSKQKCIQWPFAWASKQIENIKNHNSSLKDLNNG